MIRPAQMTYRILYCLSLSALLVLLTSCDASLDRTLRRSRKRVVKYSDEIYWQGKKIGYVRDAGSEKKWQMTTLLKQRGQWIARSIKVKGHRRRKKDAKGKWRWVQEPDKTQSTHLSSVHELYDLDDKLTLYYFEMYVPLKPYRYRHYLFTYDLRKKKLMLLSTSDKDHVNTLHYSTLTHAHYFDVDAKYASADEFKENTAETLDAMTVKREVFFSYLDTGVSCFMYNFSQPEISGTKSNLKSETSPLLMAYVDAGITTFGFYYKFHYETDFGYRNGDVKTDNEAREQFNLNDKASFVLKTAAGFRGWEVSYLTEHYQHCQARYSYKEDPLASSSRKTSDDISFETKRKQIDLSYHFTWENIPHLGGTEKIKQVNDWYVGYRYLSYKSVQIIYTLNRGDDKDPDDGRANVVAESKPQEIETTSHQLGVGINNFTHNKAGFALIYALELYGGYGYTHANTFGYYYDEDEFSEDEVSENRRKKLGVMTITPGATLGISYLYKTGRFRAGFFARYDAIVNISTTDLPDFDKYSYINSTDADIFHKVSAGVSMKF